jgi:hypothetical protein
VSAAIVEECKAQRCLAMSAGKKEGGVEDEAVANFRAYLRIPSVQPDVNYGMFH